MNNLQKDMTLDDFKLWSYASLRNFLCIRGKSTKGDRDTLANRCLFTYEENVPVDKEAVQHIHAVQKEYMRKLKVGEHEVLPFPDPFSLTKYWIGEKDNGMLQWPSVFYPDIRKYLQSVLGTEGIEQLDRRYKQGKAFSYFKCEYVKEVFYHSIEQTIKYCFLKCKVCPSQRLSQEAHNVWALVRKDGSDEDPGGQILSAYCSCVAGLLGGCNHVIGLLFRVEAAVRQGITKPRTSQLSQWNIPTGSRTFLHHRPVSEMTFTHHKHARRPKSNNDEDGEDYESFQVYKSGHHAFVQDKVQVRASLYENLKTIVPQSSFIKLMEEYSITRSRPQKVIMPTVKDSAVTFELQGELSEEPHSFQAMPEVMVDRVEILMDCCE